MTSKTPATTAPTAAHSPELSLRQLVARFARPHHGRAWGQIANTLLPFLAVWSVMAYGATHGWGGWVLALAPLPDAVLVDAFRIPALPMAQRGVVKGDRQCAAIAAASILAKVTRDRLMDQLHANDPRYGFDRHKGYATADHLSAVARHGYSEAHRRSFRPPTLFDGLETASLDAGEPKVSRSV